MLTFSEALVVFTLGLIPIYLAILMISERARKRRDKRLTPNGVFKTMVTGLVLVVTLTFLLLHLPQFKTTATYAILLLFIACILLFAMRISPNSGSMNAFILLSLAVTYHIILLYSQPFGMEIWDRTIVMEKIAQEGSWNPDWHIINPTYNPFPMDIYLFYVLSALTSIPWISKLSHWVVFLPFIIVYDLVLYALTKRITGSWLVGTLAIFLLATTPLTNIIAHQSKWFGSLLVLISILALIKALDRNHPIPNIIVANITYTAAIFMHASAVIGAFLPLGIIATGHFVKKSSKAESKNPKHQLLRLAFITFIVITIARQIHTAGYLEGIVPFIKNFVFEMFEYPASQGMTVVLYESVNPIYAYAWGTSVSMASALVLYYLLKKRTTESALVLSLYFTGIVFLFFGFLSAFVRAGGFQGVVYPAFAFLMPAAAVTGKKALKSPKLIGVIFIILMIVFAGVAIRDPMLSFQQAKEVRGVYAPALTEDYVESTLLVDTIPPKKLLIAPAEITVSLQYLDVAEAKTAHIFCYGSVKDVRSSADRAVYDGELLSGVIYVLPYLWFPDIQSRLVDIPVSIVYDSGRYVIFEETNYGQ